MLRAAGKEIPTLGNELYDGGCLAYGQYYYTVAETFDINENYPEGTLIGRYFTWERSAAGDQGHVAVVLANGNVLQSYDAGGGYPGVNPFATIEGSHEGGYYEYAVRPGNWIGSEEDDSPDVAGDVGSAFTVDHLLHVMPQNLSRNS